MLSCVACSQEPFGEDNHWPVTEQKCQRCLFFGLVRFPARIYSKTISLVLITPILIKFNGFVKINDLFDFKILYDLLIMILQ